jgi:hypothetical protein
MVVGLDERRIQHAVPAFDVHSSLISIEATGESTDICPLAARRICRQVRSSDTVLLLEKVCALVLPVTPFSGAQAVASRIAQCLIDIPCQLRVYHGATALLVLQNLREAGARSISHEECAEMSCSTTQRAEQMGHAAPKEMASDILPYLAFLTNYPPPRLLHLLPYELAYRYQCVPVGAEHKVLTLATCRWLNREIVAQLHSATRREIFQVRCEMAMIDEVLHYWQRLQAMADLAQVEAQMDEACHSSR